jgi:hypothetical protein
LGIYLKEDVALVGQSDSPGKEVNADGLKERGFGKSF